LNFGTPTPVFYQIVFVLFVAMGGAAYGVGAIRLFFASTAISYVLFIASVGGFKSSEAFAMGAGWGVLIMMLVVPSALIAVLVGKGVRAMWLASREAKERGS
jgi:hypothetical protein